MTAVMWWRRSQARLAAAEYALSAIVRPGRRRGRPFPRRRMLMASISGMNRGESPCWPGLVSRATGRQRRSAVRWILVVSPPRERPIASRPVFLSFAEAPREVISGKGAAGPGRVLVRAVDRGIGADRPALDLAVSTNGPQPGQDLGLGTIDGAAMTLVMHSLLDPKPLGQIPP